MARKNQKVEVSEAADGQATTAAMTLQTKPAIMSGLLALVGSMTHEQLMQFWPDAQQLASSINPGAAQNNAATLQMKPSDAVGNSIKEETSALFEGEELTEDAQTRIATLIENAVDVRVSVELAALEEQFKVDLVEKVAAAQDELVEKIDGYVTYAAEQWIEKNQVAIESTLKVEKADRLMEGLKALMAEAAVEIPEGTENVVESLESKIEELTAKLNESTDEIVALREQAMASTALRVFEEVSKGLTIVETDRFKKLVENVEVGVDEAELRNKLTIIKEAHFKKNASRPATGLTEAADPTAVTDAEVISEEKVTIIDPRVSRYADAISRASNKRYLRGPFSND